MSIENGADTWYYIDTAKETTKRKQNAGGQQNDRLQALSRRQIFRKDKEKTKERLTKERTKKEIYTERRKNMYLLDSAFVAIRFT